MAVDEFEAMLTGSGTEVYKRYIDTIADRNLCEFKNFIHDRGPKAGEPLYTHIMSGIGVLARLADTLDLSEEETSVLFAAFTVHDLNKLEEFRESHLSFNKLTTLKNVRTALEHVDIGAFFPDWQDYLQEIDTLVRAHSSHKNTAGELTIKNRPPNKLSQEAVERLVRLIRAADIADLSRTLEERAKKADILYNINAVSPIYYQFATHHIAEQRGLLTNLLHNVACDYITKLGGKPLLFYPDGIAYLVPSALTFGSEQLKTLATQFADKVAARMSGGFEEFISARPAGIKIEVQCLDQSPVNLWRAVLEMIQGKQYGKRIDENIGAGIEKRLREKAKTDVQAAILLEKKVHHLPADDTIARIGELVRTYYIFLADHFTGKGQPDPWVNLYVLLEIPQEVQEYWKPLDVRYDRGYIVGVWLAERGATLQSVWSKLVKDAESLCGEREKGTNAFASLAEYALRNLSVSLTQNTEPDWSAALRRYITSQHQQCSLCGSEFDTQEWMAADVPSKQKVQQFSNRLLAGTTREPKRYVCTVCRTQYLLDKLTFKTMDASTRYFAHFYPYTFFTPDYLQTLRNTWQENKGKSIEALLTNIGKSWRETEQRGYPVLISIPKTVTGVAIPQFPEAVGNIFTVPINAPGDSATERFLHAIQSALLWKLWLGCRVALTESPQPPFSGEWQVVGKQSGEFFVDGIPAALRGLVRANELGEQEGRLLIKRFEALHHLQGLVADPKSRRDPIALLARSLSHDELEPFWVMDRLILRKEATGKPGTATFMRRDALPYLTILIEKEGNLSHIKRLAEIAWEGKLKGDSLKDTALAKPLDTAFAALSGFDTTIETLEDLRAVTTKEVEEAIERVTDATYWGKTKIGRVEEFVGVLFDGLLAETYHGDVSALLTNKRRIRAAFLHYIAAQVRTKSDEKELKA